VNGTLSSRSRRAIAARSSAPSTRGPPPASDTADTADTADAADACYIIMVMVVLVIQLRLAL
jgi:hypothetical protein